MEDLKARDGWLWPLTVCLPSLRRTCLRLPRWVLSLHIRPSQPAFSGLRLGYSLLLLVLCSPSLRAQCTPTHTTGTLQLEEPVVDCPNWDTSWNYNFQVLDTTVSYNSSQLNLLAASTTTTSASKVNVAGDTMTGQLTLKASTLTVQGNAFSVGGSTFVVIASSVGINTNSPQTTLDVNGSLQAGLAATRSTFSVTGALTMASSADVTLQEGRAIFWNGTAEAIYGSVSSDYIRFKTSSADRMHIDTGGNIGFNTNSPQTKLDVNGSAQFGSGVTKSTFSTTGALTQASNAAITLSGASGNILSGASVTASGFFGDGSKLTGIPSTASISGVYLPLAGGTMAGAITMQDAVNLVNNTSKTGAGAIAYDQTLNHLLVGNGTSTNTFNNGAWTSWTPIYTGFTGAVTTNLAKYSRQGRTVSIVIDFTGTSNLTTLTFTLPYINLNTLSWTPCSVIDAGSATNTMGRLDTSGGSTLVTAYIGFTGGGWTGSGTKAMRCSFTYEAQNDG